MDGPSLFISYAHADEDLCKELEEHIALLVDDGVISGWYRRRPGSDLGRETGERLRAARVILLLASAGYVSSAGLHETEAKPALERARAGTALVIPVLLSPHNVKLGFDLGLSPVPRSGQPVTSWTNRDEAWAQVAAEIREAIAALDPLDRLEEDHDWEGLATELERRCATKTDPAKKAAYHLRLGRVLEDKLLQIVRALKSYQDAYKADPGASEPLPMARSIYWDLGKIPMVQKLLELEIKGSRAPAGLLIELGDALADTGDYAKAAQCYTRARTLAGPHDERVGALLRDLEVDWRTWRAYVEDLTATARIQVEPAEKARLLLRAARVARRFSAGGIEALLGAAYQADPANKEVAALYEQLLVDDDRAAAILEAQRRVLDGLSGKERGEVAFRYGARWAVRHQNPEIGAKLLEEALEHDPRNAGAFLYLRDLWGVKHQDWDRVGRLVETAARASGDSPFMLAQAAMITWQHCDELGRSLEWYRRLAEIAPDHRAVRNPRGARA